MKPILVGDDPFISKAAIACFLVSVGLLILVGIFFGRLPPEVPLFYSRPWGEDQIVLRIFLFMVPGVTLLFTFLGMALSRFLAKDVFVLRVLWGGCAFASGLGAVTVVRILFLLWVL